MIANRPRRIWEGIVFRARSIYAGMTMPPMSGASGPAADPANPPADPPANQPPQTPPADPPRTFTQEDLDRIVGERLSREREKFSDYDELHDKAEKWDKQEAEQQSELEREQTARAAAEKAAEEATDRANTTLRRAEITAAAAAQGIDAETVHALLAERGFKVTHNDQTLEVTIGDDGQVTGAEEAVKAIAEQKNLVGTTPTPPSPGDGGPRQTPPADDDLDAQIAKAQEEGDWPKFNRLNALKLGKVAEDAKG